MKKGLTSMEAEKLLKLHGLNIIKEQKKKSIFLKFFEQFNNFLTILLIIAAVLSFFIGEVIDGSLILTIVILNALFGLYQEKKAEEAIQSLRKMTITKVRVVRDGKEREIDSRYLIPEDVIYIEEGSKVPADCLIIETLNLEINESALTGESLPVNKKVNEEIFMGTVVVRGRGFAKVEKTGMQTKFGNIASELSLITEIKTPLQKKLEGLTRQIGLFGIIISLIVFLISLIQGGSYFPAFLLSVSLAVAVVPEGLPAVLTITLAIGVKEMSKRKTIVKKLAAIEALGGVSLIATDKTGTLTSNKMEVKEIFVDNKVSEAGRSGSKSLNLLLLNGILCSTASLVYVHDHNKLDILGDPTEGALLLLAQKLGLEPNEVRQEWKIIDEQPFDSVTKRMSVLTESQKSIRRFIFSKGAPESILDISDKVLVDNKEEKLSKKYIENIKKTMELWARKGLRVLAFSYLKSEEFKISNNLTFLGMVAMHDPPRPEVTEALDKTKKAGIKVVMITGDNEITAEAIGVSVGLMKIGDEILTGSQIDSFNDEQLINKLKKVKIFARTTPFHKFRIVKLYQKIGEIVAVTGDGVNDTIALKQADVGVAMGLIGTDVARETADLVITDDNFATIVNAIEEGRNIIKNIKNAIKYLLSCNFSEASTLVVAMTLGIPNFFYPIQLLYINLITDGLPALALAFSPRQDNLMKQSPSREQQLLKKQDTKYILTVGLITTIIILIAFFISQGTLEFKKTIAFTVLTLSQSFILVDVWISRYPLFQSFQKMKSVIFITALLIPFITQYLIVSFNINTIFSASKLSIFNYMYSVLIAATIFVIIRSISKFLRFFDVDND